MNIIKNVASIKGNDDAVKYLTTKVYKLIAYALGDVIYSLLTIALLFTKLYWLGIILLGISIVHHVVNKLRKKSSIALMYIDSVICIIATILAYRLFM